ncbi:MAG: hypothetical protein QGG50_02870 [Methanopyri archaeon]|jgi:DNA-binding transcriptional ArsR family regulator|nr:hypothetical protein [Methanopyri archaeon]|tara:strand:- start:76 stop:582 length:507 start_codon:yes stop_codon:yes gene_type:complete
MRPERVTTEAILSCLRASTTLTATDLAARFRCAKITVFRKLAGTGYLRSYDRNGTFLAHPDAASFDDNGLWEHHGAHFSRWRDLSATITALVDSSSKGLTAGQLADLLGHSNVHHHLTTLVEQGRLHKQGSRRSAVYLSKDPKKRKRQVQTPRKRKEAHQVRAADTVG